MVLQHQGAYGTSWVRGGQAQRAGQSVPQLRPAAPVTSGRQKHWWAGLWHRDRWEALPLLPGSPLPTSGRWSRVAAGAGLAHGVTLGPGPLAPATE